MTRKSSGKLQNRPQALKVAAKQGSAKGRVTSTQEKKLIVSTGDKNAQVLAATVGGAVLGNLIAPGIGGVIIGGIFGAVLGNSSNNKGAK